MDLNEFEVELISRLSDLEFVESWNIIKKRTTLKVTVYLKRKSFLSIFYNMILRVQSFALIINKTRVWGLDRDNRLGWHEHPIDNPDQHETIEPHNIKEIIQRLTIVWRNLSES